MWLYHVTLSSILGNKLLDSKFQAHISFLFFLYEIWPNYVEAKAKVVYKKRIKRMVQNFWINGKFLVQKRENRVNDIVISCRKPDSLESRFGSNENNKESIKRSVIKLIYLHLCYRVTRMNTCWFAYVRCNTRTYFVSRGGFSSKITG